MIVRTEQSKTINLEWSDEFARGKNYKAWQMRFIIFIDFLNQFMLGTEKNRFEYVLKGALSSYEENYNNSYERDIEFSLVTECDTPIIAMNPRTLNGEVLLDWYREEVMNEL